MKKSYIWSLPTRVFHFLFALFILIAFLTDDDKLLNYHAIAGYSIFILLVFRVYWGYFGPKYSLFKDFPANKNEAKEFLKNIFDDKQKYIGHNPLASYVMIAMLIVTFIVIVTGILAYGIQDGKGIASFLNDSFFKKIKLFKEIHEFSANFLIFLIVAHLAGIAVDRLLHKKHETLNSIATGYKMTQEDESIKLSFLQKLFAIFIFIAFIAFLIFNIYKPNNALVASKFEPIDYKTQNISFVNECGSCHTLYPTKFIA
ncbi:cytochrome B [Aliarcobacter cryaerophilus ATCC 43158]|uniref:Cytochrome b n=1 Tax=Aliarcobacter cryaerophilus ATCC 43158 TaxID=1032070 RepID=A0AAD0TV69_9BACT|nr:cytochrome b/b6 domain-containing protein [Aliarcobacter cryaerophilus]AYJ81119.1 cytochrome b [Aliarcobacter cryaerophilus ATCC 43158]PRM98079.1 cytochrome B [Aliarcobacter cryaerophilus]QCZ24768.1 cytochrome B [Aliarcobacter cryaerophilus ATCC 43158]